MYLLLCTFFIAYTQNDVFSNIMKTLIINALDHYKGSLLLLLAKFLEFVISDLGDRIGFDELLIINYKLWLRTILFSTDRTDHSLSLLRRSSSKPSSIF